MTTRLLLVVLMLGLALAPAAPAAAAKATKKQFSAKAFGTTAFVGNTVIAGRTAVSVLGCGARVGAHSDNTVASATIGTLGTTGTISTKADALRSADGSTTTTRTVATTETIKLLSKTIKADAVKAVSKTSRSDGRFTLRGRTKLLNLVINGRKIAARPAPNTTIDLPGLGEVVVNRQIRRKSDTSASLTVQGLFVKIDQNNDLGIAKGTRIIVSHARSGMKVRAGILRGHAYTSRVTASAGNSDLESGRSALVFLPCSGTDGKVRSNSVGKVIVPDDGSVLQTGTGVTTSEGTVRTTSAKGKTTARVENVAVLEDLTGDHAIKADVVKAVARVNRDGGETKLSARGSRFVGLSVAGRPGLGDDVKANTTVQLEGVGILTLRKVTRTAKVIEVRMIELQVTVEPNPLNVPAGTTIVVGVAKAGIR